MKLDHKSWKEKTEFPLTVCASFTQGTVQLFSTMEFFSQVQHYKRLPDSEAQRVRDLRGTHTNVVTRYVNGDKEEYVRIIFLQRN